MKQRINTIMTPKTDISWLDVNEPEETILNKIFESKHSILPVSDGFLDNFLGVVQIKDIIKTCSPKFSGSILKIILKSH